MAVLDKEIIVKLRTPHPEQAKFINSKAKRKCVRAGRRAGKTVGIAILAIQEFLAGKRVLYAAPTGEQADRFWFEINRALGDAVEAGVYKRNETERYIERPNTENRIKAKTAWNANTLRGDYADLLILDEWQLMAEDTWDDVGSPMLLDNNGDAVFIYTPPSLKASGVSKARDPRHAAKMFKAAMDDPRWAVFHFTSHDNPYISEEALGEIIQDMSRESYRKEILAEDDEIQASYLVYGAFKDECKIQPIPIPPEWPVFSGHDFGTANPAALFFAQDPKTGWLYAFAEYLPGAGHSTAQNVQAFQTVTKGYTVHKRVGGSHQEDEIRQGYMAHSWPITEPSHNEMRYQVDAVINRMERDRIKVFSTLHHYIEELNNCMWTLDRDGIRTNDIQDEKKFHLCACCRYIVSDLPAETVVQTQKITVQRWG